MRIDPTNAAIQKLTSAGNGQGNGGAQGVGDGDFAQKLMDVMKEVNNSQQNAAQMQNAYMTGQRVDIQDLMIAVQKASVAMQLTMAVRNKILDAYQEIERMPV